MQGARKTSQDTKIPLAASRARALPKTPRETPRARNQALEEAAHVFAALADGVEDAPAALRRCRSVASSHAMAPPLSELASGGPE